MKIQFAAEFTLTLENLNTQLKNLRVFLKERKINSRNSIRLIFTAEEFFLKNIRSGNDGHNAGFTLKKFFGKLTLNAYCCGNDAFSEEDDGDGTDFYNWNIVGALNVVPRYSRHRGRSEMDFSVSVLKVSELTRLMIAFIGAILVGVAGRLLLPASVTDSIADGMNLVCRKYTTLLLALALPQMFFLIINSLSQVNNVGKAGRQCGKIFNVSMVFNLLCTAAALLVCSWWLVPQTPESVRAKKTIGGELLELLVNSVPENLITPFIQGNMIQVVLIALAVGFCLLLFKRRVQMLMPVCEALDQLFQILLGGICKLLPFYIFLYGCCFILKQKDFSVLYAILPSLGAYYGLLILSGLAMLLFYRRKTGCSAAGLLKKQRKSLMISFSTGSGAAAYQSGSEDLIKNSKLPAEQVHLLLPLAMVFCKPGHMIMRVMAVCLAAALSGQSLGLEAMLMLGIVAFVSSLAVPLVPGGGIALFPILLAQFNLPQTTLPLLIVFYIVTNNIKAAHFTFCTQTLTAWLSRENKERGHGS